MSTCPASAKKLPNLLLPALEKPGKIRGGGPWPVGRSVESHGPLFPARRSASLSQPPTMRPISSNRCVTKSSCCALIQPWSQMSRQTTRSFSRFRFSRRSVYLELAKRRKLPLGCKHGALREAARKAGVKLWP